MFCFVLLFYFTFFRKGHSTVKHESGKCPATTTDNDDDIDDDDDVSDQKSTKKKGDHKEQNTQNKKEVTIPNSIPKTKQRKGRKTHKKGVFF